MKDATKKNLKILFLFILGGLIFLVIFLANASFCCKQGDNERSAYIHGVENLAGSYFIDHGIFPEKLDDLTPTLKKDYWGHENKYILEPYLLILVSPGKDGVFGTDDDITSIINKNK